MKRQLTSKSLNSSLMIVCVLLSKAKMAESSTYKGTFSAQAANKDNKLWNIYNSEVLFLKNTPTASH